MSFVCVVVSQPVCLFGVVVRIRFVYPRGAETTTARGHCVVRRIVRPVPSRELVVYVLSSVGPQNVILCARPTPVLPVRSPDGTICNRFSGGGGGVVSAGVRSFFFFFFSCLPFGPSI